MRRLTVAIVTTAAAALLVVILPASAAAFGLHGMEVTFTGPDGSPSMQAGSHPFAMTTTFDIDTIEKEGGKQFPTGAPKDLEIEQAPGFTGNPDAVPHCSTLDFLDREPGRPTGCANATAIGMTRATVGKSGNSVNLGPYPVYSLEPPPGVAAKIGFWVQTVPLTVDIGPSETPPYNIVATIRNTPQVLEVFGSELTLWGVPADPAHDPLRGSCLKEAEVGESPSAGSCPANIPVKPFITMPRSCNGPMITVFRANSWQDPGTFVEGRAETHDEFGNPLGARGCGHLGFSPHITNQPTTDQVESPTGLDFDLNFNDEGIGSPSGIADSDMKRTVVTLPEGVTLNPSAAEGLAVCTPAQYALERVDSEPGDGCPEASKVGTLEVETPILEGKILKGQVFVAQQDDPATIEPGKENPFDSLLAIYLVIKDPGLGVMVKQAGKVEPDPKTGQLISSFDEIPQVPVGHLHFHFREGGRSPLITPPACGAYTTEAQLTPWANPDKPLAMTASFHVTHGLGGGPCPPAGPLPFAPGFEAGSLNNNAGSFSPFYMRLIRHDGEQDMTRFDSTLPPGMVAKLAGATRCSDAQIAAAKAKTGRAELASPSCPASSQIGRLLSGAGVGSQLTYVPGKLYMAGPFGGAPLSVVGIVPAVAGPFDVGTVVVREVLQINPRTAKVHVDGAHSDPIPHILAGIPLKVRDIRVYVDRPEFTLNPTGCDPSTVAAQLWGGGSNVFSSADDAPFPLAVPFQAANCANLGFKPNLSLRLKGGMKRGGHPSLRAIYKPRLHDANLSDLVLRLPHSAFLDQAHIRTICTRVQFAANACPPGAVYGHAKAITPLLAEPLAGPIYLRSSNHNLPDLVVDLHGLIDVEAVARLDSAHGGIRTTFSSIPDAPITKVITTFPGGSKGLIINSRGLCASNARALAELTAHNDAHRTSRPLVQAASCKAKSAHRGH
jgi:hypothetical protein